MPFVPRPPCNGAGWARPVERRAVQGTAARLAPAVLAIALALVACTPALNWRELRDFGSSAALVLPCKPERTTRNVPLGGSPTELDVVGCAAGGATFAVMVAQLPAGQWPDEVLAGWQQATLANMQATPDSVRRSAFRPHGGLPLAQAQRVAAQGQHPDGRPVQLRAVWSAHSAAGGGTELLHAVLYAEQPQDDVADAFFGAIRWP